ncbi:MAG: hypothetical protein QM831_23970 [Kofleriaceae bacterium]
MTRVVRMVSEKFHRDIEGRPLREGRTPKDELRPDDIEYKVCPYSGSRQGKQMNASALRQTGEHWDEIVDALAVLRGGYATGREYDPDLMDLWRVSQLGSALPWWFILRGEPLPAYAAALSKATLGVGIWSQRMLMQQLVGAWTEPVFTAANIMELAEQSGTLVAAREVCAGSEKMLTRFFEVYIDQTVGQGALVTSRDEVLRFGSHYANFKLVMWIYWSARRYLYWDINTPASQDLLKLGAEPPDFFILEPPMAAKIPPPARRAWFEKLAKLVVPFAPDGSDATFSLAALRIAEAVGETIAPAAMFAKLDQIFVDVVKQTEAGLGGDPDEITTVTTDQLIAPGTRALFASL